ncbi:hypothetical protein U1Q18_052862 [Sarracenia purpurea var. burkii]
MGRQYDHGPRACSLLQTSTYFDFLSSLTLANYAGCFACFLPQYLCAYRDPLPQCDYLRDEALVKGIFYALVLQAEETIKRSAKLANTIPSAAPQDFIQGTPHEWAKKMKRDGTECYRLWPVMENLLLVRPPLGARS